MSAAGLLYVTLQTSLRGSIAEVPVLARRLVLIIPRDTKYASVCLPSADVLSGKVQLDWHGSTYPLGFWIHDSMFVLHAEQNAAPKASDRVCI